MRKIQKNSCSNKILHMYSKKITQSHSFRVLDVSVSVELCELIRGKSSECKKIWSRKDDR